MKIFYLLLKSLSSAIGTVINTQSGTVRGSIAHYNQIPINAFLGIPFAEPPVGDLRFRKTVPVQTRSTPIIANTKPPACVQYFPYDYPWSDNYPGQSEDCLYLNIWVPATANRYSLKAVMFWSFSGGLSLGSNRKPVYDGHVLAAEGDVIVVTANYRLNVFGFLSTGIDDAPGNMGLYDVLEALKWVNNNIQAFGGDISSITIFGCSAGSLISGYLTYTPLSKGQFQQAIMESGAPTDIRDDDFEINLKRGQKLAVAVGCASNSSSIESNPHQVVECLKRIEAMELAMTLNSFHPTSTRTFVPIYGDEFLPKNTRKEIFSGNFQDVRLMIGNVKDEGSYSLVSFKPEEFGPFGEKNPRINKSYGEELILEMFKDFEDPQAVANHYLGDLQEHDYDIVRSQVYHAKGDYDIFCPSLYFAESFARKGNAVYAFYITHQPSIIPWARWMGVTHFSEVAFVFGRPIDTFSSYTEAEKQLSENIIKLWTNFAKFGVPSWNWKQFTPSDPYYKRITVSVISHDYLESHKYNCDFFRKYFYD